jgi:lactate dehydrogenase-like 2-hydroxyacid dehydrogenase
MPSRLLCAVPLPPAVADRAVAEFDAILSQDKEMGIDEIVKTINDHPHIEALLVSSRVKLGNSAIVALPPWIKIVATCSVGTDHIDLAFAQHRGLAITNTPDVLTDATADLAFMLLLCAARRAREYAQIMDRGWRERFGLGDMLGIDVSGATLGILGMGRIGQAVARRAEGFGMKVIYHNRKRLSPDLERGATYYEDLPSMLPRCRFLSLHAPGGVGADSIINRETLALLPPNAVLINTARGQLVDEEALYQALTSGQLAAAGLDVFRNEPEYDQRFSDLPNVFLTPHMGSAAQETRNAMGYRCLDNISAALAGNHPPDRVA